MSLKRAFGTWLTPDSLMEWLQHSQKKYCELCKTPFQFTKRMPLLSATPQLQLTEAFTVYDPKMPKNLPPLLFLSRASKHLVRTIVLWLRFLVVCFVWLGILPWVVRWMWRFWFWLGDGGWAWWWRRARPYIVGGSPTHNSTFSENVSSIALHSISAETIFSPEKLDVPDQVDDSNGNLITQSSTLKYELPITPNLLTLRFNRANIHFREQ